ncbi:hypothetical protein D3C86_2066120 [compost metagenome]
MPGVRPMARIIGQPGRSRVLGMPLPVAWLNHPLRAQSLSISADFQDVDYGQSMIR